MILTAHLTFFVNKNNKTFILFLLIPSSHQVFHHMGSGETTMSAQLRFVKYLLLVLVIMKMTGSEFKASCRLNIASAAERIVMDSIQINPGDNIQGQQQGTKYSDPYYLNQLGYTARSTSMEQNPALCISYKNADRVPVDGVFATDRNSLVWVNAYCQSLQRIMNETIRAGLQLFFFTDMIVFPNKLLEYYPEIVRTGNDETTTTTKSSILYNNYTEYLLTILFDEWMEIFPLTSGIIVRTGETYTFDTPYHSGSSPIDSIPDQIEQNIVWVRYIQLLRNAVCVQYQKTVVFRTWFSITDTKSYINITRQVLPHPLLYFSVKHTQGDFFRQMSMNALLNIGTHQQILEIQIQREYEGKGSYPLYLFEHIVLHDESSGSNRSLSDFFVPHDDIKYTGSPSLIQGLWTWSRGGGWWGPYIHNNEFWIDLNVNMFLSWWNQWNCTTSSETVIQLFQSVCSQLILSSTNHVDSATISSSDELIDACLNLRESLLLSDKALLYGRYCLEVLGPYGNCWIWTRDDRIGGITQLQSHMDFIRKNDTQINELLLYRQESLILWKDAMNLYESKVSPTFIQFNPQLDRQIQNSFLYAQSYFCILEAAWRALVYGYIYFDFYGNNRTSLREAISDYDACWNIYRATGLTTPGFPSYYKGIYWNFPFEAENDGMDATINDMRKLLFDKKMDGQSSIIV